MRTWIVKAANWESKPLTLWAATKLADTMVDNSETFTDVSIRFYSETITEEKPTPKGLGNVYADMKF